ncbi:MAG: hypothetical protein WC292_05205 [Clostridia bacterium]
MEKIKKFISEHESLLQLIKFTLISCIAAVAEVTTFFALNSWLLKSLNAQSFQWFIFNYDGGVGGGLGTMIAFLVSTTIAQVISFITNRKKTFNANNNLAFSITVYTIMVLIIIGVQTYTGPIIVTALERLLNNPDLSSLLGKFIWMFASFCIVFVMNKFVIMRKYDEEEEHEEQLTVT